jgi:hypothetical protein
MTAAAPGTALSAQIAQGAATPPPDLGMLAVSIAAQSHEGARQFDIRLDPVELGRVDVRLTVDSLGHAQAHLAVEKPQTLDLLQRDAPALERALRDSGMQLGQSGLQFSLRGQDRQPGLPPSPRSRNLTISAVPTAGPATGTSVSGTPSGIDIRV